ncbi:SGNH/GDSL hydrolase family protein [Halalkalicoccus salilacus]|uniref:SGNH/GDSL hydrolase family protein n=1 Tax=Halalkalicoccus salilacus TaxID=3117459 RepID=UPI00300F6AE5
MSERHRDQDRDVNASRPHERVRVTRGRSREGSWGDDHSDSKRSTVSVRVQSRFPDLDDYDRNTHTYRKSYVNPSNGYSIGVSACGGLEPVVDSGRTEDLVDEIERERRRRPGSGDDPVRSRQRAPTVNIGGRTKVPDDVVAWHWALENEDGEIVSRTRRRANLGPDGCGATVFAPELGRYRANLRLELRDGEETAHKSFQLRKDRLIVSIGDSYASGQGVPDENSHPLPDGGHAGPVWVEPGAYRSFRAGPALAAKQFEDPSEGDLVTFLSYASSGAEIEDGLLGAQHEWQDGGQLDEVERAIGDRSIDALLLSIGGNDVGFADGLKELLYRVDKSQSKTVRETEAKIKGLIHDTGKQPAKFDRLAARIKELDPEQVFITEYPTAHFDRDDGAVDGGCGAFNLDLPERITGIPSVVLPRISKSDAKQIKRLGVKLNEAVEKAADRHGWTYVDGIEEGFEGHGYCSDDRYFVTVSESYRNQRDIQGTMHPNRRGQRVYADRIAATLQQELDDRRDRDRRVRDHRERDRKRTGDTSRRRDGDSDTSDRNRRSGDRDQGRDRRNIPDPDRRSGSVPGQRRRRR